MKRLLTFLLFTVLILSSTLYAQIPPNAFNYSAVARDASGQAIATSTIGIQISILQSSTTGTSVYTENHFVNTDEFGLFNLVIGAGAVQSGSMTTIDWAGDNYYLKVGMDASGGTNFLVMGTTQLLSVPYALHSATADSIVGGLTSINNTRNIERPWGYMINIFLIASGTTASAPPGFIFRDDYFDVITYKPYTYTITNTNTYDIRVPIYNDNPNIVYVTHDFANGDFIVPAGKIFLSAHGARCVNISGGENYTNPYCEYVSVGLSWAFTYPELTVISFDLSTCSSQIDQVLEGYIMDEY